jgi:hypothetical protein
MTDSITLLLEAVRNGPTLENVKALESELNDLFDKGKLGQLGAAELRSIRVLHRSLIEGRLPDEVLLRSIEVIGTAGLQEAEPEVRKLLDASDWILREAAVRVLMWHWKLGSCAELGRSIAINDDVAQVRSAAVTGLGCIFSNLEFRHF